MIKKQNTIRSKRKPPKINTPVDAADQPAKREADRRKLIDYFIDHDILSKETLRLDPETLHDLYEKTYQVYAAGQYAKAKSLFGFLMLFNPSDSQFLYGYATCCFMLKEFDRAADCYVRCGLLDPSNPVPYFYAADCYMHRQDLLSTCMALKMALKRADDQPEFAEIKQRAQLTLDALTSKSAKQASPIAG